MCAARLRAEPGLPSINLLEYELSSAGAFNDAASTSNLSSHVGGKLKADVDMERGATAFFLPLELCLDSIALARPVPQPAASGRVNAKGVGGPSDVVEPLVFVANGSQRYYRHLFLHDDDDDDAPSPTKELSNNNTNDK